MYAYLTSVTTTFREPIGAAPPSGPGGDQIGNAGTCGDTRTSFCTLEIKVCGSKDAQCGALRQARPIVPTSMSTALTRIAAPTGPGSGVAAP